MRFPAIARLLRIALLRLPTNSRIRQKIFARSIRDNAEAYARRDYDAFMIGFDPEIVIDTGDAFPETGVYRGNDGVRRFLAMQEDAWGEYGIEPEEIVDLGQRYVLLARHRGRGRGSGIEVDHRVGLVGDWRDGMLVRMEFHWSPERAFEAAGVRNFADLPAERDVLRHGD